MYFPFSMSDEPDLGDEFNGVSNYGAWDQVSETIPDSSPLRLGKTSRIYTQEEMTKVIQHSIKNTRDLELKLFYAKQLLNGIYNKSEKLPDGYSQKIREFIT